MAKDKVDVQVHIVGRIAGVDVDDVQALQKMAPADIVGRLFHNGDSIRSGVTVVQDSKQVETKAKK